VRYVGAAPSTYTPQGNTYIRNAQGQLVPYQPGVVQGGVQGGYTRIVQGGSMQDEVRVIDEVLEDKDGASSQVVRECYQQACRGSKMKPNELQIMAPNVAQRLKVPQMAYSNHLQQWFGRFDFDGDGSLSQEEAVKLFMRCLREYRIQKHGKSFTIPVPWKTPREAGLLYVRDLGQGGQGAMKLYQNSSGENKCVKFYDKSNSNAGGIDELRDEFELMKSLTNPHLARTFEVFQDASFYYLVNEPYSGGDLTKLTKKATEAGVTMTEGWWRDIFVQCFAGLDYLHRNYMMHCDIKEPNIMCANDDYQKPHMVLIDFGLAAAFGGEGTSGGTPGYMPPEVVESYMWYPKGDTWSMGVVIFQLLTGRVPQLENPPFVEGLFHRGVMEVAQRGQDPMQHIGNQTRTMPIPFQEVPFPNIRPLLQQMLNRDRRARWKVSQCLQHPWCKESTPGIPMPEEVVEALRFRGAQNEAQEQVVERFVARMNLAECRNINAAFEAADRDRNGYIDAQEAVHLLADLGVEQDEQQWMLDSLMDQDTSTLSYQQFMEKIMAQKALHDMQFIRELFDELDADKSGYLDKNELRRLLAPNIVDVTSDEDAEQLLQQMDQDRNGLVSFDEFCRMLVDQQGCVAPAARRQ
jgi:serine/threonine protein kinase